MAQPDTALTIVGDERPAIKTDMDFEAAIDRGYLALWSAQSIGEFKIVRDTAEAYRALAQSQRKSLEMQNIAAELKLRAERGLGELLKERESVQGRRTDLETCSHRESKSTPTLTEMGIDHNQSHRYQRIADVPEPEFERHIEDIKAEGKELTTAGVLRMAVHYSSDSPEWYTPRHVIDAVTLTFGSIDLDPCSNSKTEPNVPARHHLTVEDDGLAQPWFGRVYMNPPYGREIGAWVDKLAEEFASGHTTEAVALVPARTDTAWFRRLPDGLACFIAGRLAFSNAETNAPFPSVAWYIGPNPDGFTRAFSALGDIYARIERAS